MKDRRSFFRSAIGQVSVLADEVAGRPQLRLSDLPGLPDTALASIVPALLDGVRIQVADGGVRATLPGSTQSLALFEPTPPCTLVFNRFGQATLGVIAEELASELGWPAGESFAHVRSFFLKLVSLGVCVPRDPLVSEGRP